jgi:hypothetical protein
MVDADAIPGRFRCMGILLEQDHVGLPLQGMCQREASHAGAANDDSHSRWYPRVEDSCCFGSGAISSGPETAGKMGTCWFPPAVG